MVEKQTRRNSFFVNLGSILGCSIFLLNQILPLIGRPQHLPPPGEARALVPEDRALVPEVRALVPEACALARATAKGWISGNFSGKGICEAKSPAKTGDFFTQIP